MHVHVATLLALQCTLCLTIRVPIAWNDENSEVNKNNQFSFEQYGLHNVASSNRNPIPAEYFQYTAQKPKFAVDVAKLHGVQSPEEHYKAYPIRPKPESGKLQKDTNLRHPHQESLKKNEAIRNVSPSSTSYEVFHPYKLEEPALKELYQDPVMQKIRSDLENNKIRLQKHEHEAGKADITKDEHLEGPEEIDLKKLPHKNVPAPYEVHRPQRRPVYYSPPIIHNQREQVLNQKLRHPLHQNHIKVKPVHYRPVKNHLQKLRQQHALKYDDERNEYPQLPIPEKHSEPPEGYDIYEKGKAKFVELRNNVDESLNEAVQRNRPQENKNVELSDDEYDGDTSSDDEEEEFVPIKNYAQVRKTETTKHLPKEAAYQDADTLEEIQNAPRLREAIKSTKAQTVYSEEGYEDSAYDHAGEQKHASDHEEHRGSLKEKEQSSGKYKSPGISSEYQNEEGSEYRDQVLDGKKWKDDLKNTSEESDSEEYSEKKRENIDENNVNNSNDREIDGNEDEENYDSRDDENKRIKREPNSADSTDIDNTTNISKNNRFENDVTRSETKIHIPTSKLHTKVELKTLEKSKNNNEKYPYYYNKLKGLNKDSPLRYAENLKFIPNKSEGGTEFYDSRSKIQCPEVDDNIDPIPKKLQKDGHPDDDEEDENENTEDSREEGNSDSTLSQVPRLKGLGDKIDCFKAKYFGKNPLDSPFFEEEIIESPEPVTIPSIDIYRLKQAKQQSIKNSKLNEALYKDLKEKRKADTSPLLNDVNSKQDTEKLYQSLVKKNVTTSTKNKINATLASYGTDDKINQSTPILQKEGLNKVNIARKRRAAPFVYEPYKIIRDSQIQDSKKTTTTNNISPLIKQLQSSRVVDKVTTNTGKDQIVKRSANSRLYKDIGKNERGKHIESKGSQPLYDASFVDVNADQRRGEPRYELRSVNHNSEYSPAEKKKSMTVEEYQAQTNSNAKNVDQQNNQSQNRRKANRRRRTTTVRPYFDVSKFLPQEETDKSSLVEDNIEKITNQSTITQPDKSAEIIESKEYSGVDDKTNNHKSSSTPVKAPIRKKITDSTTTVKPESEVDLPLTELPKLRVVTRFRNSDGTETSVTAKRTKVPTHIYKNDEKISVPKYREKKKKISKSTLVTDTNSYGEDDDDDLSKEEEVDALIGVKHDIEEYLPTFEIEADKKDSHTLADGQEDEEDFEEDDHKYEDEEDDNDEAEDEEDDDNDDEDEEVEEEDETEIEEELIPEVTTSEPTKRTLIRTTEAPLTTTEARSAKLEIEPVVIMTKLNIHKELPVNRSSPHITEFKQDIKEVEIIKESPLRPKNKPQKNIEALELYKDENLAKDINKLGGVEVFKEGLDLVNGPKHGGNYRVAEIPSTDDSRSSSSPRRSNKNSSKGDVETSQSKTSKIVEVKDDPYARRRSDIQRARNNRGRSAKLIELSDATENPTSRPMHGGNFKAIQDLRRRGGNRNAKLIELVDQPNRDDHSTNEHDSSSRSYGSRSGNKQQMHGGNYRSAKLVKPDVKVPGQSENVSKKDSSKDGRQNSALLLNSFARVVSVSTSPTPYILDPSKRMYYYVEA